MKSVTFLASQVDEAKGWSEPLCSTYANSIDGSLSKFVNYCCCIIKGFLLSYLLIIASLAIKETSSGIHQHPLPRAKGQSWLGADRGRQAVLARPAHLPLSQHPLNTRCRCAACSQFCTLDLHVWLVGSSKQPFSHETISQESKREGQSIPKQAPELSWEQLGPGRDRRRARCSS